jgi:hypothetical protein
LDKGAGPRIQPSGTPTCLTEASSAGEGKGEPLFARGIEEEKKSAAKPADRLASARGGKQDATSFLAERDEEVAHESATDRKSSRRGGKGPAARWATKGTRPSALDKRSSIVERARKKLEDADRNRSAVTREPPAAIARVPVKGPAARPVEEVPTFAPPRAATYVTLVLRIGVGQPGDPDSTKQAKKAKPPKENAGKSVE